MNLSRWKGGPRLSKKRRLLRNKKFITEAKSKPCSDCKIQYPPWVMQFDHRDQSRKKFELGDLGKCYSLKTIRVEIEKCDVVCANCHLHRTYLGKAWLFRKTLKSEPAIAATPELPLFFDGHYLEGKKTPDGKSGWCCAARG